MSKTRLAVSPRLLICGVPGAGKSHFVKSLAKSHGFRVLQYDIASDRAVIVPMIRLAVSGQHVAARALLGARVGVEWGFMPDTESEAVAAVINAGFEGWWFAADLADALPAWKAEHPTTDERFFHLQAARITSHRATIERLFRGYMIRTLDGDEHLTGQQILEEMARRRRWKR